jgi:alkyl hydroperoxide reductase subunit AhpC
MTRVQVGSHAPDFKLPGLVGKEEDAKEIALSDYRGCWVVLYFYPLDFTFVCPTEITGFNKAYKEFKKLNAEILGVRIDSFFSHKAWRDHGLGTLEYPLLSDLTKEAARAYSVLLEEKGYALRGTFIIDPDGILRFMLVHDDGVGRSVKETLRVLAALQTGANCPVEWQPGEATL